MSSPPFDRSRQYSKPTVLKGCLKKSPSPRNGCSPRKSISFKSTVTDLEDCQRRPPRMKRKEILAQRSGTTGCQEDPFEALAFQCERDSSSVMGELGDELEQELRLISKDIDRLNSLGRMVEEENEEIRLMHKFHQRSHYPSPRRKITFNEFVEKLYEICSYPAKEKPDDEVQTEAAAAMLHLEEIGLNMTSSPAKVFSSLFPVESNVVSLADARLEVSDGITIPMARPTKIVPKDMPYEDAAMLDFIPSERCTDIPQAPVNSPGSTNLPDLLGTSMSILDAAQETDLTKTPGEFQITLDMMPSTKACLVQIQGSHPPHWFPGYFAHLPNIPGIQKFEKPFGILEKAWKAVVPSRIKPKNGPIIVGT